MPRAHPDSLQNENIFVDVMDGSCQLNKNSISKYWVGIIRDIIFQKRNLPAGQQQDEISDTLKNEFSILTYNLPSQDLEVSIKVTIVAMRGKTTIKHIQTFSFPEK